MPSEPKTRFRFTRSDVSKLPHHVRLRFLAEAIQLRVDLKEKWAARLRAQAVLAPFAARGRPVDRQLRLVIANAKRDGVRVVRTSATHFFDADQQPLPPIAMESAASRTWVVTASSTSQQLTRAFLAFRTKRKSRIGQRLVGLADPKEFEV